MWDQAGRALLVLIGSALLGGGGLGIYRLLRLQRRETSLHVDTAAKLTDAVGVMLDRYERRDAALTRALEDCEDERNRLRSRPGAD